jgi:beta-ribofuranosylaminobenzene 5'-phosphate synthase
VNLSKSGDRIYGGAGLLLDDFATEVEVAFASATVIECDDALRGAVSSVLDRAADGTTQHHFRVVVRTPSQIHSGLGTTTGALLGVAFAIAQLLGQDQTPERLVAISERGGASGVGVNAFFIGGVLADQGHQRTPGARLVPSEYLRNTHVPAVAWRCDFPNDWRVALFAGDEPTLEPAQEKAWFDAWLPLPEEECEVVAECVYSRLKEAVTLADLRLLNEAFHTLRNHGLKRLEIGRLPAMYKKTFDALSELGIPASLSSFGPIAFAIFDDARASTVEQAIVSAGFQHLGTTRGRNLPFATFER